MSSLLERKMAGGLVLSPRGPKPPKVHLPAFFPRSFSGESMSPWSTAQTPWWSLPGWSPTTMTLSEWGPGGCGQGEGREGRGQRRGKAVIATTGHDSRSPRNLPSSRPFKPPTGSEVPGSCPRSLERGSSELSQSSLQKSQHVEEERRSVVPPNPIPPMAATVPPPTLVQGQGSSLWLSPKKTACGSAQNFMTFSSACESLSLTLRRVSLAPAKLHAPSSQTTFGVGGICSPWEGYSG